MSRILSPLLLPRLEPLYVIFALHALFWSVVHWYTMLGATEICLRTPRCRQYLRPGQSWLMLVQPALPRVDRATGQGLWVDAGDHQWQMFREAFPLILVAMTGMTMVTKLVRHCTESSLQWQLGYYCLVGVGFLAFMHGSFAVHVLALVCVNFWLARLCGQLEARGVGWLGPAATWALGIGAIVGSEWFHGRLEWGALLGPRARVLDQYRGEERWWISVNVVMLRMVSHNMDYFSTLRQESTKRRDESSEVRADAWALQHRQKAGQGAGCEECQADGDNGGCYKYRERINQPLHFFSFAAYLAYCLYPPLYIAGPIMSFNAWLSNVRHPPQTYTTRDILAYAGRIGFTMVVMECFTSYLSLWAILRSNTYEKFGAFQMASFAYMNLKMIWMKFLLIWRLFRLWAILDGIVPVENMNRCISNNIGTISAFWRAWHRSFNRWLVRYVYVPVGGRGRRVLGYFVTFTFVAVWHDRNLELLTWGWLLVFFFIPEYLGGWASQKFKIESWPWYQVMFTVAGGLNLSFLIIANAVGFGLNRAGVSFLTQTMFSYQGVFTYVYFIYFLVVGSNLALFYRQAEKERFSLNSLVHIKAGARVLLFRRHVHRLGDSVISLYGRYRTF
eukprot:g73130.t1